MIGLGRGAIREPGTRHTPELPRKSRNPRTPETLQEPVNCRTPETLQQSENRRTPGTGPPACCLSSRNVLDRVDARWV